MGNKSIVALLIAVAGGCTDPSTTLTTASNQQAVTANPAQVSATFLQGKQSIHTRQAGRTSANGGISLAAKRQSGPDTIINFSDSFTAPGFDSDGNPQSVWPYTMVGRDPKQNRTTRFNAPVIPVTVELLDASGHVG